MADPPNNQDGAIVINGRATRWLLGLFSGLLMLLFGLMANTVLGYGEDIRDLQLFQAETRANRFNDEDALAMFRDLTMLVATTKTEIEAGIPPREVLIRLEQIEEVIRNRDGN